MILQGKQLQNFKKIKKNKLAKSDTKSLDISKWDITK